MSTDIWVQSFTHLKDRKYGDRALVMLQRIASLVKPIMRKRRWLLPTLAEFFPDDPNLLGLNVNRGQKILVRLRPDHSPDSFMPEEDVVQTMLHELTHNIHGPHDEKFYKFLSGLQEEYSALQRSGYSGEVSIRGFFSNGHRLGTNISHNLPPHQARAQAIAAAETRRNLSQTLGGSRRLGGGSSTDKALTPRERAAKAAERRLFDAKSCSTGEVAEREAEKAANESERVENVIDLTLDDDDSEPEVIVLDNPSHFGGASKTALQVPKPPKPLHKPDILPNKTTTTSRPASSLSPSVRHSIVRLARPRNLRISRLAGPV
ncbi:hypothetical protein D9757_002297 [Collybiopsis confluens]|uniref:WLM domain-containing protein n=1 Tax=Collybiopsis confluens TaxID=2823264 RepID=A0A8H5HZU2_9AGAR|nr:hypothetical protein D9757_002297 [Collybiopsis confluens]